MFVDCISKNNMNITKYLTEQEQDKIKKMYQAYLDSEEKARIMFIALSVDIPAALVKEHILEQYGEGAKDNLLYSDSHYIDNNKGYIRYKDYYNIYEHQFVICRELGIKVKDIGKYTVHHRDKCKTNNRIDNLHLFFNAEMHTVWHWIEEKEPKSDIIQFTYDWIEKKVEQDISNKERKDLREYIRLINIQINKQKNIPSNKFADLQEGILELQS